MGRGSWKEVTWPIYLTKWWEYNSPLLSQPCIHPIHLSRGIRKQILSYGKTWMNMLANPIQWLCKLSLSPEGQSLPLPLLSSLSHTYIPVTPAHLRMRAQSGKVIPELLDKQQGFCRVREIQEVISSIPCAWAAVEQIQWKQMEISRYRRRSSHKFMA